MRPDLGPYLDALYERFHRAEHLAQDPLWFPRQYEDTSDQETVALLASSLAFGNVKAFMARCADLLRRLGPRPSETLADLTPIQARKVASGFRHRFVGSDEMASLLWAIGRLLADDGGLKPSFLVGFRKHGHVLGGLSTLAAALSAHPGDGLPGPGFLVPLPTPSHASKRLLLFLRWMVRRDGMDLGLWHEISPSDLVMPLDVHVFRVAGFLGLLPLRRSGPRLRHALDLTEALRRYDAQDPVRYDFALSHLGISRACRGRADPVACPSCPLLEGCAPARAGAFILRRTRLGSARSSPRCP